MSHLGIEKVHKILTLQRISREMLALFEKKANKSKMLLVVGVLDNRGISVLFDFN